MEYLGAGGPVKNSLNIDKAITTLAINTNLKSYIEDIANRTKSYWQSVMRGRKEKLLTNAMP